MYRGLTLIHNNCKLTHITELTQITEVKVQLATKHNYKIRWLYTVCIKSWLVHYFFTAPESVLYFSIGLGVHEILQVIPAKNNWRGEKLTEFVTSFAWICPNFTKFPRTCPNFAEFARIMPEICPNSYIGKKKWGARCPPTPRLLRLWVRESEATERGRRCGREDVPLPLTVRKFWKMCDCKKMSVVTH